MKKIIISVGIVVAIGLAIASVWAWSQEKLFLRVPAKITLNGVDSDKSAIYKSRNGSYFLILEKDKAERTTYWISKEKVGIPDGIIPSLDTLSFQTKNILICLDVEIDILGEMSWEGVNPKLLRSDEEISFQVKNDNVSVKF